MRFHSLCLFLLSYTLVGAVVLPPTGRPSRRGIVRLTYATRANGRAVKQRYVAHVPRGYRLMRVLGSHETELRLTYPDSSVLYLTDDVKSGSALNYPNFAASGHTYHQLLLQDTLTAHGTQANDRKWKQVKALGVIIGYVNVPLAREPNFEQALASLQRKK